MRVMDSLHYHVWTGNVTGGEYANAVFENDIDAAMSFMAISNDITMYGVDHGTITIERVVNGLKEKKGIWAGSPELLVAVSRCSGGCKSPTWN